MSEKFEDFLAKHGIQHRKSSPLSWPQAKGEVERQNRTLLKSLKAAEAEGKKWKEELDKFLLAYRITPHRSTGTTPAILMFGKELKTKINVQHSSSETQGQPVGSGEKAGRKFSSTGERAPGYRLSPNYFQKFKRMPAPDWAQKMLCIIVPNRRTVSPEFFS